MHIKRDSKRKICALRNDKVEQVYEKLEKQINHQPLSELFGLVAVTNAEKVILERIQEKTGTDKRVFKEYYG